MICLEDQDKIRRHYTFTRIHSDYPCSSGSCKGSGKGLRVKHTPRRLDAEASSKSNYTARATLAKRVSKHKKFFSTEESFSTVASSSLLLQLFDENEPTFLTTHSRHHSDEKLIDCPSQSVEQPRIILFNFYNFVYWIAMLTQRLLKMFCVNPLPRRL